MKWIIFLGKANIVSYYIIAFCSFPLIFMGVPLWQPLLLITACLACAVFVTIKLEQFRKEQEE